MSDELDNQLSPEEVAFERAEDFTLKAEKLEPFTFTRKSTAIALGVRVWKLNPGEIQTREILGEDGKPAVIQFYDGQFLDAAIVLWVCSQPIEIVKAARRAAHERRADQYEDAIDEFAEKHRILAEGLTFNVEAMTLFYQIVGDAQVSEGRLPEGDNAEKKTVL